MKYLKINFYIILFSLLICSFFHLVSLIVTEEHYSIKTYFYFAICAFYFTNLGYSVIWLFKKIDKEL